MGVVRTVSLTSIFAILSSRCNISNSATAPYNSSARWHEETGTTPRLIKTAHICYHTHISLLSTSILRKLGPQDDGEPTDIHPILVSLPSAGSSGGSAAYTRPVVFLSISDWENDAIRIES